MFAIPECQDLLKAKSLVTDHFVDHKSHAHGRQYQNHNPRPGPVYAGGGYTPINEAPNARKSGTEVGRVEVMALWLFHHRIFPTHLLRCCEKWKSCYTKINWKTRTNPFFACHWCWVWWGFAQRSSSFETVWCSAWPAACVAYFFSCLFRKRPRANVLIAPKSGDDRMVYIICRWLWPTIWMPQGVTPFLNVCQLGNMCHS